MPPIDTDTLVSIGFFAMFFGPPFLVIAVGLLFARRTWRIRNRFAGTTGTIVESRVRERVRTDDDLGTSHLPQVRFSYSVRGVEYDSGVYAHRTCMPAGGSSDEIRAIVDRLPVGSMHPIWYDPRDPSVAYLERGTARDGAGLLICGLVLLGVITGLIVGLAFLG